MTRIRDYIKVWMRVPTTELYTGRAIELGRCRTALDLGCGTRSPLSAHRSKVRTIGVDVSRTVLAEAERVDGHDQYILADVADLDPKTLARETGQERVDLVTLYDVIEHLPRSAGLELLDMVEELAASIVLIETPNGFREQGPEYGNEHQRHLSGWFIHDFVGRGYRVYGNYGTRYLREYAGGPRFAFPFWSYADFLLARLLGIKRRPRHAYSLVAIKDMRGVPARLPVL